jgi:hypothetical protein
VDITGQDIFTDGDAQLAVHIALLILRLEDKLPRPALLEAAGASH